MTVPVVSPTKRRRSIRKVAAAIAAAVVGTSAGVTMAVAPAHAATVTVENADFSWRVNDMVGAMPPAMGCNFLVAGVVPNHGSAKVWNASDAAKLYRTTEGTVSITKPNANGKQEAPTWNNHCDAPNGEKVSSQNGLSTQNQVNWTGGTGTIDPATKSGTITWKGGFTVAMYGGMTYWSVSDIKLELKNGTGKVTGTASGYKADMNDLSKWEPIPAKQIDVATISKPVTIDGNRISIEPAYRGVKVNVQDANAPQKQTGNDWGAFPQSLIDFNGATGQSSYWYSTGLKDEKKVAAPISVTYNAPKGDAVSAVPMTWNIYDRFVGYIRDRAPGGKVAVSGNVADTGGNFAWTEGSGRADVASKTADVAYKGQVEFTAHLGILNVKISNPRVALKGDGTGTLYADVFSRGQGEGGGDYTAKQIPFATLSEAKWDGVNVSAKAALTTEGARTLGRQYSAGTEISPISFTLPKEIIPTPGPTPGPVTITENRYAGENRYETSVKVSQQHGRVGKPLVLATGENYADALVAGPLADKLEGTLLLTLPDRLTDSAKAEIARLKPSEVIVLGNDKTITAKVTYQVKAITGKTAKRIAGANRIDTANQVARTYFGDASSAFVVTGWNFPDALSASALATATNSPVLLTASNKVDAATADYLKKSSIKKLSVLGDQKAVSDQVVAGLSNGMVAKPTRYAGNSRYATNIAAIRGTTGPSNGIVIATGKSFPDALSASLVSSATGYPLVLASGTCSTKETIDFVRESQPTTYEWVGSEASVKSDALRKVCG